MNQRTGFSGARVTVYDTVAVKNGDGVGDQGRYAQWLYDNVPQHVTVRVLDCWSHLYLMEKLEPISVVDDKSIAWYIGGLCSSLSCLHVYPAYVPSTWQKDFLEWSPSPQLSAHMQRTYPEISREDGRLIHGDPTLSNLMKRPSGQLVLIDPIRPVGKIPSYAEVDYGKVLQSLIGWEHVSYGWPLCREALPIAGAIVSKKAMFWLSVHLHRIRPYTCDPRIHGWIDACTIRITLDDITGVDLCSTLSTLMELSSIHAQQS